MVLLPNDEEEAQTRFKTRVHKPYPIFQPKMVKIDTLFQTKHAKENHTFWRHTYLYSLYKGGDWSF